MIHLQQHLFYYFRVLEFKYLSSVEKSYFNRREEIVVFSLLFFSSTETQRRSQNNITFVVVLKQSDLVLFESDSNSETIIVVLFFSELFFEFLASCHSSPASLVYKIQNILYYSQSLDLKWS